jgi:hypothetical protein
MSDKYRFRAPVDETREYPDGTEVPHRFSAIERERDDGTWEVVGYAEILLRKVPRGGEYDAEDVSIGFSGLVNPPSPPEG